MEKLTVLFACLALCVVGAFAQTRKAYATMRSGNGIIYGGISFVYRNNVTYIWGTITNMIDGEHGLHIHSSGDVRNNCGNIGDHYNPYNRTHSCDASTGHLGDLGNVISSNGVAHVMKMVPGMTLAYSNGIEGNGNPGVLDLSIAVDTRVDNCQPELDGNSGPPIACGRIRHMWP